MGSKILKQWHLFILFGMAFFSTGLVSAQIADVKATADSSNITYQFKYTGRPQLLQVFLDTDKNVATGFSVGRTGADYLIENSNLYRYSGSNGQWGWTNVRKLKMNKRNRTVKWTVTHQDLNSPVSLNYVAQTAFPIRLSSVSTLTLAASPPPTPPPTPTPTPTPPPPTPPPTPTAGSSISLAVEGAPNLPLNGTSTRVTVGFKSGTPTKVELSRDGFPPFATYPTDNFFKMSADGKSLTGNWCISSSCWSNQAGAHVLNVVATYATGQIEKASVNLNVSDGSNPPDTGSNPGQNPPPPPGPSPIPSGPAFYVSPSGNDSNAGTQSAPWRTIQKAVNSVNAGDVIILMNGTYEEGSIGFNRSGTSSKPITLMAQNKWQAVVSSTSGCQPGFSINASYITIKDLRFAVPKNSSSCGYTSANVHIRAWNKTDATTSNPTTGSAGFRIDGIKVDAGSQRSEGIKSNQDFTIMENSEVGHSLELFNTKDSVIRNNLIFNQGQSGISIFVKGGVRNAQIYGNVIRNKANNGQGIIIGGGSCNGCTYDRSTNYEAFNTVAYNNIVINESSGPMAGLYFQGAKDSAFFNNIVVNGVMAMTLSVYGSPKAQTSNPTFKNNIFLCNGKAVTSQGFGWSNIGTASIDYNLFHNCSSAPSQAHPIGGDPNFVNSTSDFHLQAGSSAINSGTPISFPAFGGGSLDVSRDKDGAVRSAPWDLGVYNTP